MDRSHRWWVRVSRFLRIAAPPLLIHCRLRAGGSLFSRDADQGCKKIPWKVNCDLPRKVLDAERSAIMDHLSFYWIAADPVLHRDPDLGVQSSIAARRATRLDRSPHVPDHVRYGSVGVPTVGPADKSAPNRRLRSTRRGADRHWRPQVPHPRDACRCCPVLIASINRFG